MKNYIYFIENTDREQIRDNTKVFNLRNDLDIHENDIFIDTDACKDELESLLDTIESGKRLIIRSVIDLSDDAKELLKVLKELQGKEVILCSIEEPYLNGTEYYTSMRGFADINKYYLEKRRLDGYLKAKEKGKVGRPRRTEDIDKGIRLYRTKAFSISEIEELSGISGSTLFRAMKEMDKE
ncbi:recombinase family protein [Natranaerovirga pectinivora]|uniref:recombinase family protein n=1 Tax=Natranaerovirga pectinivora TaxID=682400 RepID=UPI001404FD91|nr:recombinase family protein [Natranaerovirga pectinivora]